MINPKEAAEAAAQAKADKERQDELAALFWEPTIDLRLRSGRGARVTNLYWDAPPDTFYLPIPDDVLAVL